MLMYVASDIPTVLKYLLIEVHLANLPNLLFRLDDEKRASKLTLNVLPWPGSYTYYTTTVLTLPTYYQLY